MNLPTLVWKELWQRPAAVATSLLTILLGVATLVAIRHVTVFSEREVARQLSALGANVLILPKETSLENYYSADVNGRTLPEEHVLEILLASLPGVERLAPKLCVPAQIAGKPVVLTGILPQKDFAAQSTWGTAVQFTRTKHVGCTKVCGPSAGDRSPESLTLNRTIEDLPNDKVILGADIAALTGLKIGQSVELLGHYFRVLAVLAPTGTADDSRVFAHLHKVQEMAKAGAVVSAIEVLGCCEDAAGQLVPQLAELLPSTRVVTISQVVQTQVGVNRLMSNVLVIVLAAIVVVGVASVFSTISSNVRERRREIGTLMALGASPGLVARVFLLKAVFLGIAGGATGAILGMMVGVLGGPGLAGVSVSPLFDVGLAAFAAALVIAVVAAYWPARQAAKLDPCICFRDV